MPIARSTISLLTSVAVMSAAIALPRAQQSPRSPMTSPATAGQTGRGGAPVQGAEEDIPLVARFDRDGNKRLDYAERTAAREYLTAHPELRPPARVGARSTRTGTPGPRVTPNDATSYPD